MRSSSARTIWCLSTVDSAVAVTPSTLPKLWSIPTGQLLFILRFFGGYLVVCTTPQGVAVRDQSHAITLALLEELSGWIRSRLV